ncbi:AmmeMemoRadiSam system protein A [Selenomonas sp. TAMA-11512]|uniref:AmmeMemoRadiSam system protein A n=1 Tax=Selenomonas sp. TAMA-11512 TaxID=3095337 RepID=UPI003085B44D|nr:AmmeMemoRadiSam system protein A [Selenomonas sp. TAMA-11512]
MPIIASYIVPHPPLIIPEVGKGAESSVQLTVNAYDKAMKEVADLKPDVIILTSPHAPAYADYFQISGGEWGKATFDKFGAPEVEVGADYDVHFIKTLTRICREADFPAGVLGGEGQTLDHGTMVPLYYLQRYTKDIPIVRIGLSALSPLEHYRLGMYIKDAVDHLNRNAVFIASGDLSHKLTPDGPYGFDPDGPRFDKVIMELLEEAKFDKLLEFDPGLAKRAAECGLKSFQILAGALDRTAVKAKKCSYQGVTGVGYGIVSFKSPRENERRNFAEKLIAKRKASIDAARAAEDPYVHLARMAIENYLSTGEYILPGEGLPDEIRANRAGVFVSIKKEGDLRGCIGTFHPTQDNIGGEIIANAVAAAIEDPRFPPVKKSELDDLLYSVDVLSEPEMASGIDDLDPKIYGVIVEARNRRGLLLPDLEGIADAEEQVRIARQKGGIAPDEEIRLWRFTVERHR